jgi:PPM family protein phosphatase
LPSWWVISCWRLCPADGFAFATGFGFAGDCFGFAGGCAASCCYLGCGVVVDFNLGARLRVVAVKLLTIGEFARAARLSPKALRLYDELGLLRPHAVDKWSGYRYYTPDQLEKARFVASLRRLGMPLARIAAVVALAPDEAAAEVAAFVRAAEADLAERQRLAQFLIGHLSEGTSAAMTVTPAPTSLAIRYAAGTDRGRVRERNQDASYAGPLGQGVTGKDDAASPLLFAVADGLGPHGEQASALVIDALRGLEPANAMAPSADEPLQSAAPEATDLLKALSQAVAGAASSVRSLAPAAAADNASGSTLTALYWTGAQLALVHIGDSRAYLMRAGGLFQLTHDDSVTQAMVDAGQLTPEEAASHPQRSLLLKAIAGFDDDESPALSLRDAQAGDRYLLSSDGLTSVVPVPVIRAVLRDAALAPEDVVARLIALANDAGGPDNIACAVADVFPAC